ncbi:hypothetical protein ABPG75_002409 [Micractinium tetrahymenae]
MIKIRAVPLLLLLLALLVPSASTAAAGTAAACTRSLAPPPAQPDRPYVSLIGRFHPGPDTQLAMLPQWMSWGASSATVAFNGASSVAVVINASMALAPTADSWLPRLQPYSPQATFQFDPDGVKVGSGSIGRYAPALTWNLTGLTPGRHVLRIVKLTEARLGGAWLQSIRLSANGSFQDPPATVGQLSGKRMLFIGDSLTSGFGNTGGPRCREATENGLLAYGPLAAKELRADYQVLGWGLGTLGIYRFNSNKEAKKWTVAEQMLMCPRMRDLFPRADALNPASRYDTSAFQPQVVVLAAGINDFSDMEISYSAAKGVHVVAGRYGRLPSMQQWAAEHEVLVRQVRAAHPGAAIITLAWPLQVTLSLRTPEQALTYSNYVAYTAAHLQSAGISNTFLLQLRGEGFNTGRYCKGHPDVATHELIAAQLASFVRAVVPGF